MENIQYILYICLGLYSIIILILRNSLFNDDETSAIKVDIASIIIINFIKLSNNLYFPINKILKHKNIIISDQTKRLDVKPNTFEARLAVTIVTAVWIVNIVAIFSIKYEIKKNLPNS